MLELSLSISSLLDATSLVWSSFVCRVSQSDPCLETSFLSLTILSCQEGIEIETSSCALFETSLVEFSSSEGTMKDGGFP